MKIASVILLILQIVSQCVNAQTFQVDTLQYNGEINKFINLVVLGDGYDSTEQNKFNTDAVNLTDHLFTQSPWSNYKNYFNVFAIRVISAESGAIHSNTAPDCSSASPLVPVSNPLTYFGCSFDSYGIHRLVVPTNISHIVNVLSVNFPNYDQILIVANSPYYGGSGGSYSTSTIESNSPEITAHELGHSFASLADEYYAGDSYAGEWPNMTAETDPLLVKWKNWVGYNGIGVYQHCCGGNSSQWYKPYNNCKMQHLGHSYCNVCIEIITERIHSLVNPIVDYTPTSTTVNSSNQFLDFKLTELMKPISNTLKIFWKLDSDTISSNIDSRN